VSAIFAKLLARFDSSRTATLPDVARWVLCDTDVWLRTPQHQVTIFLGSVFGSSPTAGGEIKKKLYK
jgi:hypothetical protein